MDSMPIRHILADQKNALDNYLRNDRFSELIGNPHMQDVIPTCRT